MIAQLFPENVHTVTATGDAESPPLLPEEERCIGRAAGKRRREFAAGRACARKALQHFGVYGHPLVVGSDRAPVWPPNIVGSITHCDGFVGVAVARQGVIRGIGLDAERARPVDPDLVELICLAREQEWIRLIAPPGETAWPQIFFSAKEAVYKCLAACGGRRLDFLDVEITPQPTAGRFAVRFPGGTPLPRPEAARLLGRFVISPTHVFTGVLLTS